ncbi:hypothetical protein [Aquabacterium sp. UBA2148]|uniref:hypothetical protein n=1 Tax=Aquabacterium sp. UBA2148 TaxID=1946042 RepID=UPI00257D75D3|nr:hypothetical protein [Aquabacterium sp. UBA2148]
MMTITGSTPIRLSGGLLLGAMALLAGCAATQVPQDKLEQRTAMAIGRDVGAFTISNQAMESDGGGRMNYTVTTKDGALYQCYIYEAPPLAKITSFGMAPTTSDAICTQRSGAKPGKAAQKETPPACNALLKAAGRC